jgi:hypothetical protein
MGYLRETPSQAGYTLHKVVKGEAILIDKEDGHFELWGRSPHFAGAAIVIRGTTYEYVRRLTPAGAREYIEMIKPTKRRK